MLCGAVGAPQLSVMGFSDLGRFWNSGVAGLEV